MSREEFKELKDLTVRYLFLIKAEGLTGLSQLY